MIKTDENGTEEWTQTYGGTDKEWGRCVKQTSDGGYIITGYTRSYGIAGYPDVWLIKTDANGNEIWSKTYGSMFEDFGKWVEQTSDGGYIITGYTVSYDYFSYIAFLIKTDENGNEEWSRTYGESNYSIGYWIQQTSDGGYIITGSTSSYTDSSIDVWLIKTNQYGTVIWDRTYGGINSEAASYVEQTTDGGYIITGATQSFSVSDDGVDFFVDALLIKTDENGNEKWNITYDGGDWDSFICADQTSDGGYIIGGTTNSFGAGNFDIWLIKTDENGKEEWNQTYGGTDYEWGFCVRQTSDGGYIITGYTYSYGAGWSDVWLIKIGDSENGTKLRDSGGGYF